MNVVEKGPLLISKTSKGLYKYWRSLILEEDGNYYTQHESWQDKIRGGESTHLFSKPALVNGINDLGQGRLDNEFALKRMIEEGYWKEEESPITVPVLNSDEEEYCNNWFDSYYNNLLL